MSGRDAELLGLISTNRRKNGRKVLPDGKKDVPLHRF